MQENRGASDVENVDGPHNFMPFTVVPGAPRDQGFGLVGNVMCFNLCLIGPLIVNTVLFHTAVFPTDLFFTCLFR